VSETGRLYETESHAAGTHLALRWNGRVRFTVPRLKIAQEACWMTFLPGRIEPGLRAMASLPRLFGSINCVEARPLTSVREAIGNEAGLSCCRAGTEGPWAKETILFLTRQTFEPLYIVKTGAGEAVTLLLQNEAHWLRTLHDQPSLIEHIPELVMHHSGVDSSFVAVSPVAGAVDHRFGEMHIQFLKKLHDYSQQTMWFEESRLHRKISARITDMTGTLSKEWSNRFDAAMQRITHSLSDARISLVAAHNDFTAWNTRVHNNIVKVFDWEHAEYEQFPIFDPLHFFLLPMGLKREHPDRITREIFRVLQVCKNAFDAKWNYKPEVQALAYLLNLCSIYLWSTHGTLESDPVVVSFARVIDDLYSRAE